MYKEQFFPRVNDLSSELKPGEPEAVEELHKPESEERNSVRQISRKDFTIEDYTREWNAHPEWHGLSTKQAGSAEGRASGLGAFYSSLNRFAQRESKGDEPKREEVMKQFFPEKYVYREHYRLEDYINEWTAHPEWHGLSTNQANSKEGIASGLKSFYASLGKFATRESKGDESKRKEIIQQFFPQKRLDRPDYRLEDYIEEWNAHPEWHGLSTEQAVSAEGRVSGLGSFYDSLCRFVRREFNGDKSKRKEIIQQFFPQRRSDRLGYRLEDYIEEWNAHPEWHGLSTSQATREGVESGLKSFYVSLGKFATREFNGDKSKRKEIIQQFFPQRRSDRLGYRLEDYIEEWNAHPEWHGLSTPQAISKEGAESGLKSFYVFLGKFATRESNGDESKRREIIERFFPLRIEKIHANRGYALQHSVEIILKILGNKNLSIELPVKRNESDQRALRPDLMYEYADGERALILDVKLQTTTSGIEKDKENYSKVLQEKYPKGGNLIFLCLNGPNFPSERLGDADRVKVRYYHILDFLERLADNRRNKFLMRLISGNEEQEISQIPDLTLEQIGKITEIADQLKVLQKLVSERVFSTGGLSLEDASEKMKKIRLQLSKLAKTESMEENRAEIMSVDFKKLMDF